MIDDYSERTGYALELPEFPREILDAWGWVMAFYAWDHGDPQKLKELILSDQELPRELKPALAARISGERKPNKKAASQQKIPAADRMLIAMHFSTAMYFSKANETFGLAGSDDQRYIDWVADRDRKEVLEVKRSMRKHRRLAAKKVSERFGISVETLENIVRDMRKKAREYPDV